LLASSFIKDVEELFNFSFSPASCLLSRSGVDLLLLIECIWPFESLFFISGVTWEVFPFAISVTGFSKDLGLFFDSSIDRIDATESFSL
jgi:hypothetical protein